MRGVVGTICVMEF